MMEGCAELKISVLFIKDDEISILITPVKKKILNLPIGKDQQEEHHFKMV